MSAPSWLGRLLRARELQEERAKQEFALAHDRSARASARERRESVRLDALTVEQSAGVSSAFIASAVALQAAAATHAASVRLAAHAESVRQARQHDLHSAARSRRSAEDLAERQFEIERARAAAHAQQELDEAAAGVHRRALGEDAV